MNRHHGGLRRVQILKFDGRGKPLAFDCDGWFHIFAQDYDSDGAYPAAVVELDNGEVRTIPAHWVRFVDSPNAQAKQE